MAGELQNILVVAVEQAVAAPYASCRLADAGARVIKIERPEGDFARDYDHYVNGESAYFVWCNRGKESVCMDLRLESDRALLEAMIAKADVFLQNLAPGAIGRLGFSPKRLRAGNPRLITCSISGYGEEGPLAQLKAYDLLVQGEAGLTTVTGNAQGAARVGVSVCDIAAGMTAYQAILEALIGRSQTGEGRHIAVSLYHALADWMNVPLMQYSYGGHHPERLGLNHPTLSPYGVYLGEGGAEVILSVQNEREWIAFAEEVLERPDLIEDPRFLTNKDRVLRRTELDHIINGEFAKLSRDALFDRLLAARVAFGRVNSLDELAAHPQNRYFEVETESGPVRLLAPGATHDGEVVAARNVPAKDAHGEAIRREFVAAAPASIAADEQSIA